MPEEEFSQVPTQASEPDTIEAGKTEVSQFVSYDSNLLEHVPIKVTLNRDDVSRAYYEWYKEQISKDKRDELGRFLFGVSSASIGLLFGLDKLSPLGLHITKSLLSWLMVSAALFLLSGVCALYLAVPKNKQIDIERIELIELQRANANEMTRLTIVWFILWFLGLIAGAMALLT